jgi:hypothetical protein
MRLTEEELETIKYYVEHDSGLNKQDLINLCDTIEAQQQEIEKKEGALEADLEEIKRLCKLVQQLQAQVAKAREAIRLMIEDIKIYDSENDVNVCDEVTVDKALSFLKAGDTT